ncbi:MAG: membrane protein insertase YidC, partial [Hydrocarboniphaga effusa]|nr:membrane protein insertase YidC [Hydrocarboniphaga effusa]
MTTIENRRFALLVAAGVILFLLWQTWQKEHGSGAQPVSAAPAAAQSPAPADEVPAAAAGAIQQEPSSSGPAPGAADNSVVAPQGHAAAATAPEQKVNVETDVLRVEISTQGGDLRHVELKGYPFAKRLPEQNVALLDDKPDRWFVIQSGLAGTGAAVVSHKDIYRAAAPRYVLAEGSDQLEVPLEYTGADGLAVTKTYRFRRGSYVVDLAHALRTGDAPLTASPYVQLWRTPFSAGEEPPFTSTFMGLGFYEQKSGGDSYRFRKVSFEDLAEDPVELKQSGGWLAMLQHYFFAAVIPPAGEAATFVGKPSTARGFLAQYIGAAQEIPAQAERTFSSQLYIGPKVQHTLADIAPGLELTIDYGILTPVAEPLFWLL